MSQPLAVRWPFVLAFLLVMVVAMAGCGGGESATAAPTQALSMDAAAWSFRFSPGMPEHPMAAIGGGWQFDFPAQDGAHYLTAPLTASVLGKTITVTVQIIGDAVYTWPDDHCAGSPAKAHIMVERQGDDLRAASGRWWADVPLTLQAGASVVSVPVAQGRWTNVDGQFDPFGFDDAMTHPGFVGVTFGGGCFFGHGVWLQSGASRMIVRDFTIQ